MIRRKSLKTALTSEVFEKRTVEDVVAGLRRFIRRQSQVIVAYSGGVDSAVLAWLTARELGGRMRAVIANSASLATRELAQAQEFAGTHGIPLEVVVTHEIDHASYRANQGDRCYYCKMTLFEKLKEISRELESKTGQGKWEILYGVNTDDLSDYRPGLKAAEEYRICAPYLELGVNKTMIREIARKFSLSVADKPAMPCMASRIPHGSEVSLEKLRVIEQAEQMVAAMGFSIFRVRHHDSIARIEVTEEEWGRLQEVKNTLDEKIKSLGFKFVCADLMPFKSGSLNTLLS